MHVQPTVMGKLLPGNQANPTDCDRSRHTVCDVPAVPAEARDRGHGVIPDIAQQWLSDHMPK